MDWVIYTNGIPQQKTALVGTTTIN